MRTNSTTNFTVMENEFPAMFHMVHVLSVMRPRKVEMMTILFHSQPKEGKRWSAIVAVYSPYICNCSITHEKVCVLHPRVWSPAYQALFDQHRALLARPLRQQSLIRCASMLSIAEQRIATGKTFDKTPLVAHCSAATYFHTCSI